MSRDYELLREFRKSAKLFKVQFVGTHGTGKSILVSMTEALLNKHGVVPVRPIRELSQRFIDSGMTLNENTSLDAQIAILFEQAAEELKFRERNFHVVTDRSLIDNFAYALLAFSSRDSYGSVLRSAGEIIDFYSSFAPASHMFFVPMTSGELVADGVRSISEQFQRDADKKIQEFLEATETRHYRLPVVPPNHRNKWLSLVERTLFPGLPAENYSEPAPDEETLYAYFSLNPGIDYARKLSAEWRVVGADEFSEEECLYLTLENKEFDDDIFHGALDDLKKLLPPNDVFGPVEKTCAPYGSLPVYFRKDKSNEHKFFIGYDSPALECIVLRPPIFRPYRVGAEETVDAGVEVRCAKTFELLEDLNV